MNNIKHRVFTLNLLSLSSASAIGQCGAPNVASAPVSVPASGSKLIIPVTAGSSVHFCVLPLLRKRRGRHFAIHHTGRLKY